MFIVVIENFLKIYIYICKFIFDLILVNYVVFVFLYNIFLNDKFSCSDMTLFLKNVLYVRLDLILFNS